ncbi:hypothetical protein [Parendozoicomonas haliclonae]|uniref:CVNH domain protein n=1 Tax=Parendozoicomonas haliclonae TaxID=1960125 RepID=A0A1X7AQ98_9GAMM|nr:hypothetical protein [Parendozoicomonas haliclonae]SMA50280.1 CVNH domain protein [Parendozoicomonas haliclonae]
MMIRTLLLPLLMASFAVLAAPVPPVEDYLEICRSCTINSETGVLRCDCPDNKGEFLEQKLDLNSCDEGRVEFQGGYLLCNTSTPDDVVERDEPLEEQKPVEDPVADSEEEVNQDEPNREQPDRTEEENKEPTTEPEVDEPIVDAPVLEDPEVVDSEDIVPAPEEPVVPKPVPQEPVVEKPKPKPQPQPRPEMKPDPNSFPKGDYEQFCKACSMKNGKLSCLCKTGSGFFADTIRTWIDPGQCRGRSVSFAKGRLVCQSDLAWMFDNWTCRRCKIEGNLMKCECKRTPCEWSDEDIRAGRLWRSTELSDVRYCTKPINNCNGKLRCGKCGTFDYFEEFSRPYEGKRTWAKCPH